MYKLFLLYLCWPISTGRHVSWLFLKSSQSKCGRLLNRLAGRLDNSFPSRYKFLKGRWKKKEKKKKWKCNTMVSSYSSLARVSNSLLVTGTLHHVWANRENQLRPVNHHYLLLNVFIYQYVHSACTYWLKIPYFIYKAIQLIGIKVYIVYRMYIRYTHRHLKSK